MFDSVGFIGGGRITRIFLNAFREAGIEFNNIVVSDVSSDTLRQLKTLFPGIRIFQGDNLQPARQDLVFISLHPPLIGGLLSEIKKELKPESILISLAPKITISKMTAEADGFSRIVRMIPNAPSITGAGYNPVAFAPAFSEAEKTGLLELFSALGDSPVVDENKLEAYAVLTAMGPTYFWFQLYELKKLAAEFGLNDEEIQEGINRMLYGSLDTMFSGLTPEEVMDLIPVKPLGEEEETIREIYSTRLRAVYNRIKP